MSPVPRSRRKPHSEAPRDPPSPVEPAAPGIGASGDGAVAAGGDIGVAVTGDGIGVQLNATFVVPGGDVPAAAVLLLMPDGSVPRVGQLGLASLRVHPAAVPEAPAGGGTVATGAFPVYVPRDCDAELDRAVAAGGLVIVEGRSAAGKSRAAAESMQRAAAGRQLLVPEDNASLTALARRPPGALRDAVVWLDDLERFWAERGLTAHLFNRLAPPGRSDVVVLATLRSEERRQLGRLGAFGDLLRLATVVRPAFHPSAAERQRAEEQRADPRIAQWLDRGGDSGLAEYLAAGPAAVDRWLAGRDGEDLVGAALVSAAVDCHRAGYHRPVPLALLRELCAHYLDPRDVHRAADLAASTAWAAEPVSGASSCLIPYEDDTFGAFDYLVDHVQRDEAAPPVPEDVWDRLLVHASGDDLTSVIGASWSDAVTTGRPAVMDAGLAHLVREADSEADFDKIAQLVNAMFVFTGSAQDGRDWPTRFEHWLRPHVEAGNTRAMAALGVALLLGTDRPEEGEAWLRRAAAAGDDSAAADLAQVLHEAGRTDDLRTWLDAAIAADRGPVITCFAGELIRRGQPAEAERLLLRAAAAGSAAAVTALASLAAEKGDTGVAARWYERGVALGDPTSQVGLGVLLCRQGRDWERAESLLRAADDAGDPLGAYHLGVQLRPLVGRWQEALDCFRRAAAGGWRPAEAEAALMTHLRHDAVGLAEWWERVRETRDGGETVREFADRLVDVADLPAAARWYERAAGLGRADAMSRLGDVHRLRGDLPAAITWYRKAADGLDPRGQLHLGAALLESGDLAGAETALLAIMNVIETTDVRDEAKRRAMLALADLYRRQGRDAEAEEWLSEARRWGGRAAADPEGH
ncbi:SEL1-like repeat protein [Streptomyces sp. NBC_01477]|uniref:SEL1-like repeat protein n=1 Tax=Streptomyces sp. NBC_01477 TaxID=2976015 RepID=UPI002E30B5E6|nr:SEL1-like repeat protein [Streptomyces sp. NBC_01477]